MRHRHYPHPWKWHKTYPTASRANLFRYAACRRSDKPKEILAPSELNSSLLGKVAEGNDKPVTKMRIWERKLLDFSLRNSLLNFRVTKNTMQLMTADLGKLEDELASGSDFRIMEIPTEWTVSTRDAKIFAIENEKDLVTNIAENEFKNNDKLYENL